MRRLAAGMLLLAAPAAAEWVFSAPVSVGGETATGVFAHLESAGRRSLAVQGDGVAVVWEDNRSGAPQVYLALKPSANDGFRPPVQLSTGKEAYEPAVTALPGGFLAAWEQDGGVRMRVITAEGVGPVQALGGVRASQVTLHHADGGLFAAWAEREGRFGRVLLAQLTVAGESVRAGDPIPADSETPKDHQLYPALADADGRLVVAWEDRRDGHTRLFYACSKPKQFEFAEIFALNERPPARSVTFGSGTGVTRVALAGNGAQLAAVWMDKRDFQGGYDTYAALLDGNCRFGANEKVQDLFGENTPQWHPTIAVAPDGSTVAAWDDPRDGSPDIWLSLRSEDGWSDDLMVEPAHGPGRQDNPAIAFDAEGRLHLAWLHAEEEQAVRVMYAVGTRED